MEHIDILSNDMEYLSVCLQGRKKTVTERGLNVSQQKLGGELGKRVPDFF